MQVLENAIHLIESGQTDEAMNELDALALTGDDDLIFAISNIYFEYDFLEKAKDLLNQLLKKYPQEDELILRLSEINIELKKDDEAIGLLNQINEDNDYYLPALLQLADLYQSIGFYEVSEEKLLEAKRLAPGEIIIDFALAEFLYSIGQEARAIPFYEKVEQDTNELNDVVIAERLAECYAAIGAYEKSLAYYKEMDTDNPDVLFKYGYIAAQQNEQEIAINVFEDLLSIDKDYFSAYPELARVYMDLGDIKNAIRIAKEGLKQDEFNQDLYFLLAKLSQQNHKDDDTLEYLQAAVQLDEENKEVNLYLIQWYKDRQDYEAIVDFISYLLNKDIIDPIYDWELAKAFIELETYDNARKSYDRAYKSLSHDADFLKEYGYFLVEEGLMSKAINVLQAYLEIEKTDEEVIQYIERLNDSNFD